MESSRTHFEVLGLGLEALSPRKLPCPRLEDSTIFEPLKFRWKKARNLAENLQRRFFWFPQVEIACKKIFENFFRLKKILKTFFLWRTLTSVSLVLGLERVCPWPRNFFVSLALASSLVTTTPPLTVTITFCTTCFEANYRFFMNSIQNNCITLATQDAQSHV